MADDITDPIAPAPGDENNPETQAATSANQPAYVVVPQTIVTSLKAKYPGIPGEAQTIAEAIAGIPVVEETNESET